MYRCEDTLERCVDSVLAQTCPDFELLLINDGSPDRVPEIAAGYVQRDPRVRLLSQENRGVSAARNAGIDAAKGRYLLFVDADDRLCKDAVETLLLAARGGAQVIHFAYIRQKGALSQVVPSPVNDEGVLGREEIRRTVLPLLDVYKRQASMSSRLITSMGMSRIPVAAPKRTLEISPVNSLTVSVLAVVRIP